MPFRKSITRLFFIVLVREEMKVSVEKVLGVYALRNTVTGKLYIGAGQVEVRQKDHFTKLRGGYHDNPYLQNDADQYGVDAFEFFVIEFCDNVRELRFLERYFIRRFATHDARFGYNQSDGSRWSREARLRDTERKYLRSRKFLLLTNVKLGDPMRPVYLESCARAKWGEDIRAAV